MATLFSLGHIVMTANLQRTLEERDSDGNGAGKGMEELRGLFDRHVSGDWGDLVDEDWQLNQQALETGGRLFSVYTTAKGVKLYIITEADRSITTALLPEDY